MLLWDFFSSHYVGNILNRFSEDLVCVDERVPNSMYTGLETFAETIGVTILMGSVNLTFFTICLVFCIFPIVTIIFFLRVGRILMQLEHSTRSSFIGHVNATVEGLPTIRCAKVESILMDEFDSHQNLYTSASYLYLCWFRALAFISGEVKFSNVYLSHDSDNYVLHNLNCTVEPQETIAIVGRTAAGKSSIISTILRLQKFQRKKYL
ncbi:hypothetical protein MTP99_009636 [Tenebrio molitor]|nr:hypothetical protein MTP99_009636 [Tenebrio molitor]